jgi:hypothetical protein
VKYFDYAKPTYIENWPKEICSLSIAQVDVPMTLEEADAICEIMWDNKKIDLSNLAERLQKAIIKMPNGAFVRLGSRSPKDSWYGHEHGFKVTDTKQALSLLIGDSERIFDDLQMALYHKYIPHVWVRQWVDIPKWAEFRCFMKDRKLGGISQYYYLEDKPFSEIIQNSESIKWAIEQFFWDFKTASHLDDVVFDVFLKRKEHGNSIVWEVKLLEINPFFELTDPCMFDWRKPEDFNGEFRFSKDVF